MKLTGHRTPSVFQRYNIVSDSDLTNAATLLSGQLPRGKRAQAPTIRQTVVAFRNQR